MPDFDPASFRRFRFLTRSLSSDGLVSLVYGLDDAHVFTETFQIPVPDAGLGDPARLDGILDLLHWVAGVSYYKTAVPTQVACEAGDPPPAAAAYLEALYSEGLGEFAVTNGLAALPRPAFPRGLARATAPTTVSGDSRAAGPDGDGPGAQAQLHRVLVPVGGGKDSIVALEIARHAGLEVSLFAVNALPPMQRTAQVAGLPLLTVKRTLPLQQFKQIGAAGALNGHIPITAIIACVALLTAAVNGLEAVVLANERSASSGNLVFDGVEVNHQFSKSARAEALLRAAAQEALPQVAIFSVLRPASELAIARRFAQLSQYHHAFTSCNTNFRTDPARRGAAWCRNCPKCRFVFLMLAPFLAPDDLTEIFGGAMLADDAQFTGFAELTATGGHKPFECVGEEEESLAAIEMLARDERWLAHPIARRLVDEVLPEHGGADPQRAADALALSDEHHVPAQLMNAVRDVLGA